MVRELLQECAKMYTLNHPNVLTLTGVCLDGGTAPYIVMPFMANGSLLSYLKKHRSKLVLSLENEQDVCYALLLNEFNYLFVNLPGTSNSQATSGHVHSNFKRNGISSK